MKSVSVINTITVPAGMEVIAEEVREEYVNYFKKQEGFVSSTFYKSINREKDNAIRYVNIVVWKSKEHFGSLVNIGFENDFWEKKTAIGFWVKAFLSLSKYHLVNLKSPYSQVAVDKPVQRGVCGHLKCVVLARCGWDYQSSKTNVYIWLMG